MSGGQEWSGGPAAQGWPAGHHAPGAGTPGAGPAGRRAGKSSGSRQGPSAGWKIVHSLWMLWGFLSLGMMWSIGFGYIAIRTRQARWIVPAVISFLANAYFWLPAWANLLTGWTASDGSVFTTAAVAVDLIGFFVFGGVAIGLNGSWLRWLWGHQQRRWAREMAAQGHRVEPAPYGAPFGGPDERQLVAGPDGRHYALGAPIGPPAGAQGVGGNAPGRSQEAGSPVAWTGQSPWGGPGIDLTRPPSRPGPFQAGPPASGHRSFIPQAPAFPAALSGPGPAGPAPSSPSAATGPLGTAPLDLNAADVGRLMSLPGMTGELAARIVAERVARGPYARVTDLVAREVVAPHVFLRFSTQLAVDPALASLTPPATGPSTPPGGHEPHAPAGRRLEF